MKTEQPCQIHEIICAQCGMYQYSKGYEHAMERVKEAVKKAHYEDCCGYSIARFEKEMGLSEPKDEPQPTPCPHDAEYKVKSACADCWDLNAHKEEQR